MDLQRLVKNSFESGKVSILMEDVCSEIAPIQCVVKPSSFVSTRWSWHSSFLQREQNHIKTDMIKQPKRPSIYRVTTNAHDSNYFNGLESVVSKRLVDRTGLGTLMPWVSGIARRSSISPNRRMNCTTRKFEFTRMGF